MNCSFLPEAKWIWPKISIYLINSYAGFRYDFNQKELPSVAPFCITADQAYKLYVNGKYVCRGPMRGYQECWHYDVVDILSFLKKGHNWIAIEAHNPGISTYSYKHADSAGMLCSASWDNGTKIISNAQNWIVFRNTAYKSDTAHLSVQLGRMEELDLKFDDRSWIYEEKNYTLPPAMPGISCMEKEQGVMPWYNLLPRSIPMLQEKYIIPETVTSYGTGKSAVFTELAPGIIRNIVADFEKYELNTIEFNCKLPQYKKDECGIHLTIPESEKGKFRIITFDLGAAAWMPGTPVIIFDTGEENVIVDIFYHQYLPEGKIYFHSPPAGGSMVSLASRLHLSKKAQKVELFQIMGTRQFSLIVRENSKPLSMCLNWRTAVYPLEIKGNYNCSDEVMNKIYNISVHAQQVCSMDAFVDTPWREQSQWWGDARIQARNTIFLAGDTNLLKSGIDSIAAQKNPTGLTYANAPTKCGGPILPDFSLTWIITLYDLYYQTGNINHFTELKKQAENIFTYFEAMRNEEGLIKYDKRFWLFEDWSDLPKKNIPTFINLWYIYTEKYYLKLLEAANCFSEAEKLRLKIKKEKENVKKYLFDSEQQLFLPERNTDGLIGQPSVHDQVLALLLHLCPEAENVMLQKMIIPCLNGTLQTGAQPSSFWATYLLDCAAEYNLLKEALNYIKRNWSDMIKSGTTWETFKCGYETSLSHAWSAHIISHLPELTLGIQQLSPAWKNIRLKPSFFMNEIHFKIPLPQGIFSCNIIKRKSNLFSAEFNFPERINAEIILPEETVYVSGKTTLSKMIQLPAFKISHA